MEERRPVLAANKPASILLDSWNFLRREHCIKMMAYCIMPDHFHLLLFLMPGHRLSTVMESTNKFTASRLNKHFRWQGTFWQNGFFDHRCRSELEIEDAKSYIEHNPVRKGFVSKAEDWPYSSANPTSACHLDLDWYAEMR